MTVLSSDEAFGDDMQRITCRMLTGDRLCFISGFAFPDRPEHKGTNSNCTVAKFGIAPDFESGGRGFEAHRFMVPCAMTALEGDNSFQYTDRPSEFALPVWRGANRSGDLERNC